MGARLTLRGSDQREPGLPLEAQSDQHLVDFTMWTMRLGWAVAVTEYLEFELELPLRRTVSDATFLDENGAELSDFSSIHHRDETIQGGRPRPEGSVPIGASRVSVGMALGCDLRSDSAHGRD